jgi:hypothetical protein
MLSDLRFQKATPPTVLIKSSQDLERYLKTSLQVRLLDGTVKRSIHPTIFQSILGHPSLRRKYQSRLTDLDEIATLAREACRVRRLVVAIVIFPRTLSSISG